MAPRSCRRGPINQYILVLFAALPSPSAHIVLLFRKEKGIQMKGACMYRQCAHSRLARDHLLTVTCTLQASSMLFMSPGATALTLYASGARWMDMAFGAMQRMALEMIYVQCLQVEVEDHFVIMANYMEGDMRRMRDANIALPFEVFAGLVEEALSQEEGSAVQPLSIEQALHEAETLLRRQGLGTGSGNIVVPLN